MKRTSLGCALVLRAVWACALGGHREAVAERRASDEKLAEKMKVPLLRRDRTFAQIGAAVWCACQLQLRLAHKLCQPHRARRDEHDVPPFKGESLFERIVDEQVLRRAIEPMHELGGRQHGQQRLIDNFGFHSLGPERALQRAGLRLGKIFDQDAEGVFAEDGRISRCQSGNGAARARQLLDVRRIQIGLQHGVRHGVSCELRGRMAIRPPTLNSQLSTRTYFNNSRTRSRSSFNSFTVASIRARLNSFTASPGTMSSFCPWLRTGKELMRPGSTP